MLASLVAAKEDRTVGGGLGKSLEEHTWPSATQGLNLAMIQDILTQLGSKEVQAQGSCYGAGCDYLKAILH